MAASSPSTIGRSLTSPVAEPANTPEHFRLEHETEFMQYYRGDSVWYRHKTADRKWRREK